MVEMRWKLLFLASALLFLLPTPSSSLEDAEPNNNNKPRLPHIIFVVIDDLGSGDLGRHGSHIQTPTIDQLSRDGIFLSNYYVLPACSPTRSTFMTGRYPLHTGCHTIILDYQTQGLPLDEETLPQVLRKVGYQAHAVGKWHLGHARSAQTPTFRGFQSFFGYLHGGSDYFTHYKEGPLGAAYEMRWDSREYCGSNCSQISDERGNYSTHVFTREATRIIEQHGKKKKRNRNNMDDDEEAPLFLYLAHQAVHAPDQVPPQYYNKYKDQPGWSEQRKVYAGMLTAVDQAIHNLTQVLKENGMWQDTILIGTTDNGGPTDICMIQGSSNGRRRGGKCTVWEGGTTGDAFLTGPALERMYNIQSHRGYADLFHAVDWLPTLAKMTGATPEGKPLDGVSHLEHLQQQGKHNASHPPPRQELFVGYAEYENQWYGPAIRWNNFKLLQGNGGGPENSQTVPNGTCAPAQGGDENATYLLFNLESDPEERYDVSEQFPLVVEVLRRKLQIYQETFVPPMTQNDPSCPFSGHPATPDFGPTWMPWCDNASEIVFTTIT
mmetsp:Transcript_24194/g.67082  ORF Transcript_24194/g.67082 Transcript_24194/m.67082 type:complete len:550 (-) Transcript_24194:536-2185(-)